MMGPVWQGSGSVPEIRPSQRQIEHSFATRFNNSYDVKFLCRNGVLRARTFTGHEYSARSGKTGTLAHYLRAYFAAGVGEGVAAGCAAAGVGVALPAVAAGCEAAAVCGCAPGLIQQA